MAKIRVNDHHNTIILCFDDVVEVAYFDDCADHDIEINLKYIKQSAIVDRKFYFRYSELEVAKELYSFLYALNYIDKSDQDIFEHKIQRVNYNSVSVDKLDEFNSLLDKKIIELQTNKECGTLLTKQKVSI